LSPRSKLRKRREELLAPRVQKRSRSRSGPISQADVERRGKFKKEREGKTTGLKTHRKTGTKTHRKTKQKKTNLKRTASSGPVTDDERYTKLTVGSDTDLLFVNKRLSPQTYRSFSDCPVDKEYFKKRGNHCIEYDEESDATTDSGSSVAEDYSPTTKKKNRTKSSSFTDKTTADSQRYDANHFELNLNIFGHENKSQINALRKLFELREEGGTMSLEWRVTETDHDDECGAKKLSLELAFEDEGPKLPTFLIEEVVGKSLATEKELKKERKNNKDNKRSPIQSLDLETRRVSNKFHHYPNDVEWTTFKSNSTGGIKTVLGKNLSEIHDLENGLKRLTTICNQIGQTLEQHEKKLNNFETNKLLDGGEFHKQLANLLAEQMQQKVEIKRGVGAEGIEDGENRQEAGDEEVQPKLRMEHELEADEGAEGGKNGQIVIEGESGKECDRLEVVDKVVEEVVDNKVGDHKVDGLIAVTRDISLAIKQLEESVADCKAKIVDANRSTDDDAKTQRLLRDLGDHFKDLEDFLKSELQQINLCLAAKSTNTSEVNALPANDDYSLLKGIQSDLAEFQQVFIVDFRTGMENLMRELLSDSGGLIKESFQELKQQLQGHNDSLSNQISGLKAEIENKNKQEKEQKLGFEEVVAQLGSLKEEIGNNKREKENRLEDLESKVNSNGHVLSQLSLLDKKIDKRFLTLMQLIAKEQGNVDGQNSERAGKAIRELEEVVVSSSDDFVNNNDIGGVEKEKQKKEKQQRNDQTGKGSELVDKKLNEILSGVSTVITLLQQQNSTKGKYKKSKGKEKTERIFEMEEEEEQQQQQHQQSEDNVGVVRRKGKEKKTKETEAVFSEEKGNLHIVGSGYGSTNVLVFLDRPIPYFSFPLFVVWFFVCLLLGFWVYLRYSSVYLDPFDIPS